MRTADFLDALRIRFQVPSDYALAPMLGVTRQQVSKYRLGKDSLSDEAAIYVAELLEIDPAFVLASCHAERAKADGQRAAWERIAARFAQAATVAAVAVGLAAPSPAPAAHYREAERPSILIMSNARRMRRGASSVRPSPFGRLVELLTGARLALI